MDTPPDTTAQQSSADAFELADRRWRDALDGAGHGVWEWNVPAGRLTVSATGKEILGYGADEPCERIDEWLSRLHPDDVQAVRTALDRHLSGESPSYHVDQRIRSKDGGFRWVCTRGRLMTRTADGNPLVMIGTHTDISEQVEAEAALKESRARYERAVAGASDGIWEWYPATDAGYLSPRGKALLGYGADDPLAVDFRGFLAAVHPDDRARATEAIRSHLEERTAFKIELRLRLRDGSYRWFTSRAQAEWDEAGRPLRMSGSITDITDDRRSQSALQLRDAALRAAASGIVITDRTGAIVWANPAFSSMTGYAFDEAVGRNPRELLKSGHHDSAFYARFWETLLDGRVWRGEMINRRKDGSVYPESMTVTPVRNDGTEITHFVAIKQDLTATKALEERYLQAQRMESVGRLAAGIAHDFNNLLTVINSTAELAGTGLSPTDPLAEDLDQIASAGRRAADLTRQLLAFSRKQMMKLEPVDLGATLFDLEKMVRRTVGEDLQVAVVASGEIGIVRADRPQIEQAILNLVVNARDAMPGGGRLCLEAFNAEVTEPIPAASGTLSPGAYVALRVSDTGVGMDDALQKKGFEPFFTTKQPGKGTGLGLSTVFGIVTQSGGSITLDSAPGRGSTFTIYLPRVPATAVTEHAPVVRAHPSGTELLLLVEDEANVRAVTARILRGKGYRVLTASDGYQALRTLDEAQGAVELVITDVVMPGMSGHELAERIASDGNDTKILFTSGYTDDEILRHGVLNRKANFLDKPYTAKELTAKVREVLDTEPAASPPTHATVPESTQANPPLQSFRL